MKKILFFIFALIFLVFSNLTNLASAQLFVNASAPEYVTKSLVNVDISSPIGTRVRLYVNDQLTRALPDFENEFGNFTFRNVLLPQEFNALKIEVTNTTTNESVYAFLNVTIDKKPPKLNVAIPEYVLVTPYELNGSVDENVVLKWQIADEFEAPPKVLDLTNESIALNEINLKWRLAEENASYLVFRNGNLIALITAPEIVDGFVKWQDRQVEKNKTYIYEVAAVDKNCNVGEKSSPLTVISHPEGSEIVTISPIDWQTQLQCQIFEKNVSAGNFSISLNLPPEKESKIRIEAIDKAGHTDSLEGKIYVDTQPPQFIETNLHQLSPTYKDVVKVKGKVSEKASVKVILNNRTHKIETTDEEGNFEIEVKLERIFSKRVARRAVDLEIGEGFANSIVLEALDRAGRSTKTPPDEIVLARCGMGADWQVKLGAWIPDVLNPRLLMQGVHRIGIPFEMSYNGRLNVSEIRPGDLTIKFPILGQEFAKDFDNGLVGSHAILFDKPDPKRKPNFYAGYIQLDLTNFEEPNEGLTTIQKERNVSEYRKNTCLVPGLGCIRLLLEMEINYEERYALPTRPTTLLPQVVPPKIEKKLQRTCLDIEIPIDKPVPVDKLPKSWINSTIRFLDKVIDAMEKIVKPIETVATYTFYACGASQVFLALYKNLPFFGVNWACNYGIGKDILEKVFGGQFDERIAESGLCEVAYNPNATGDEKEKKKFDTCMRCQKAWENYHKMRDFTFKPLCDRVFCPTVPTLQHYVIESQETGLSELNMPENANQIFQNKFNIPPPEKFYYGDDCAAKVKELKKKENRIVLRLGLDQTREIYEGYVNATEKTELRDYCKGLHPADPRCCGFTYMKEWDSGCGVGGRATGSFTAGLDTFNEAFESVCIAANRAGTNKFSVSGKSKPEECNFLWNAVTGFCSPKGTPPPDIFPKDRRIRLKEPKEGEKITYGEEVNSINLTKEDLQSEIYYDKSIFIAVFPNATTEAFWIIRPKAQLAQTPFRVQIGLIVKELKFEKEAAGKIPPEKFKESKTIWRINQDLVFVPLADATKFFDQKYIDAYHKNGTPPEKVNEIKIMENFQQAICQSAGYEKGVECVTLGDAKKYWKEIVDYISTEEKEYVVDPTENILQATRCICLPGITGWINQYKSIARVLKNCVRMVHEAGAQRIQACEEFWSRAVCDAFFSLLQCFSNKVPRGPGNRIEFLGGIGNVIGSISGLASDITKETESRYGRTGLYKTMFADKKILRSLCNFAFTGTWDLDFKALFKQGIEDFPINSTAAFTKAERRFLGFDPNPLPGATGMAVRGLTTQLYSLAAILIPGSDVRWYLELKCSRGFGCDPNEFKNGECDCNKLGERILLVDSSTAKKGDTVDISKPDFIVEAARPDSVVRYDTAILRWEALDPRGQVLKELSGQTETSITGVVRAPAFCSFDVLTLSFRCFFGFAEHGIKIVGITPEYPTEDVQIKEGGEKNKKVSREELDIKDTFILNEPIKFNLELTQRLPADEFERQKPEYLKYLQYEIYNEVGTRIYGPIPDYFEKFEAPSETFTLKTHGNWRKLIDTGFKVNKDNFSKASPGFEPVEQMVFVRGETAPRSETLVKAINITPATKNHLVLVFRDKDGKKLLDIYEGKSTSTLKEITRECEEKSKVIGIDSGKNISCGHVIEGKSEIKISAKGFNFTIKFDPTKLPGPGEVKEVWIKRIPFVNPCDESYPTVTWTVKVKIYDADKYGNPSQQIAYDPDTGESAEKEEKIKVRCVGKEDLKEIWKKKKEKEEEEKKKKEEEKKRLEGKKIEEKPAKEEAPSEEIRIKEVRLNNQKISEIKPGIWTTYIGDLYFKELEIIFTQKITDDSKLSVKVENLNLEKEIVREENSVKYKITKVEVERSGLITISFKDQEISIAIFNVRLLQPRPIHPK